MKGVVFTEFLSFVEAQLGADMVDQIIDACADKLSTGGAYTAVGTYPCAEMVALLGALSEKSGMAAGDLLQGFGKALSQTFVKAYPTYYNDAKSFFDFVAQIDSRIHVEVLKLYPDAELPRFAVVHRDNDNMALNYSSPRGLQDLAIGLFHGSAEHYGESVEVKACPMHGNGAGTRFELKRA